MGKTDEEYWKIKEQRAREKKEQIINFIVLMMEEYEIYPSDLG